MYLVKIIFVTFALSKSTYMTFKEQITKGIPSYLPAKKDKFMDYNKKQENRQICWRKTQTEKAFPQKRGMYKNKNYEHILPTKDWKYNLFPSIRNEVEEYHKKNNFKLHTGKNNLKSSYIACFNHLFLLRNDKNAVLEISKTICNGVFNITDVLKIPIDKQATQGYIVFEYVNKNREYLQEKYETRGKNCTSLDAFVKANDVGIGIEWKYTEKDYNKGKAYWGDKEHRNRYEPLLTNSNINSAYKDLIGCQMFYELTRQTLLLEQMKAKGDIGNYLNIVICPKENTKLWNCCEKWKSNLKDPSKFKVISPQDLFANICKAQYKNLLDYLQKRYW
jgi:hypothetical protein